jgi:hypothetical protein
MEDSINGVERGENEMETKNSIEHSSEMVRIVEQNGTENNAERANKV